MDRRTFTTAAAATASCLLSPRVFAQSAAPDRGTRFRRVPTEFIAALADPTATAGNNAQAWGVWHRDPGPRGVRLGQYQRLVANDGIAPAGWHFDPTDWWLEENGLIMESPEFPLAPGQYMVTGNRTMRSVLTIEQPAADGTQSWTLDGGATVYDVTHLRCRSARYTSLTTGHACTPALADQANFPVTPGAEMPPVKNCGKQDYAVLFVIGVAA